MQISPKLAAGAVAFGVTATAAGLAYNHVDRQRRNGVKEPNKMLAMGILGSGAAIGSVASMVIGRRAGALAAAGQAQAAARMSLMANGAYLGATLGPITAYGAYNSLFDTDGRPNLLDPIGNVQRRLARSEVIGDKG